MQRRVELTDDEVEPAERAELVALVRRAHLDRVLAEMNLADLPHDETRVLRCIVEGVLDGEAKKARTIACELGLGMGELERLCDRLLARGLIGPSRRAGVS